MAIQSAGRRPASRDARVAHVPLPGP